MFKVLQNINAYVEQDQRYKADSVIVTLTEHTREVTEEEELATIASTTVLERVVVEAYPADVSGVKLSGSNPLVVKDFGTDLTSAIEYYNSIEQQLCTGDIIREV